MTRVVLDASLLTKLHNLTELIELTDDQGRVVARVVPVSDLSQYEPLEPQVSNEELDRRSRSNERTYTTDEVLAHLENL